MPTEEKEKKTLLRGAFMGMSVPTLILIIVLLRQFGADNTETTRDSGAPVEVQERVKPIIRRPPQKVFSLGANRTVRYNAANPYSRGNNKPSMSKEALAAYMNATKTSQLAKPWELREAKNAKQIHKKLVDKASKSALKTAGKHEAGEDAAATTVAGAEAGAPSPIKVVKAKKVFDASSKGKGFAPGDAVVPSVGTEVKTMKQFKSQVSKKCGAMVGFYNSEDAEMSKEFAAVWNTLATNEATKFSAGYVDVRTPGGLEIAVNASVLVTEDSKATPLGTPAILVYYVTKEFDSSSFKVVYKNAQEVGPTETRAGKDAKKAADGATEADDGAKKGDAKAKKDDKTKAPPTTAETVAAVTKKLINLAEGQKFALSKEGCFLKHKDKDAARAAADAKAAAKDAKKAAKNATATEPVLSKKDKKKLEKLEESEADAMANI